MMLPFYLFLLCLWISTSFSHLSLSQPHKDLAVAVCAAQNHVLFIGGQYNDDSASGEIQVFDSQNLTKVNFPSHPSLNEPRFRHTAIGVGDDVYIAGGTNDFRSLRSIERYSCSNHTVELVSADLETYGSYITSAASEEHGLIFFVSRHAINVFNISTQEMFFANAPRPQYHASCAVYQTFLLIAGSSNGQVLIYDFILRVSDNTLQLSTARQNVVSVVFGGQWLVFGGQTNDRLPSSVVDCFDLSSANLSQIHYCNSSPLPVPRSQPTLSFSNNQTFIGADSGSGSTRIDIFDHVNGAWRNLTLAVALVAPCVSAPSGQFVFFACDGNETISVIRAFCPLGSYCPIYSLDTHLCPGGKWHSRTNYTSEGDCDSFGQDCLPGFYCPDGSSAPILCDPGKFCDTTGLAAPSGNCSAGYYCAAGSTNSTAAPCPAGHYCLEATPSPSPCPAGRYCPSGTGVNITNEEDLLLCPERQYCASGKAPRFCDPLEYCPVGLTEEPCQSDVEPALIDFHFEYLEGSQGDYIFPLVLQHKGSCCNLTASTFTAVCVDAPFENCTATLQLNSYELDYNNSNFDRYYLDLILPSTAAQQFDRGFQLTLNISGACMIYSIPINFRRCSALDNSSLTFSYTNNRFAPTTATPNCLPGFSGPSVRCETGDWDSSEGTMLECRDTNECEQSPSPCGADSCYNFEGGYFCEPSPVNSSLSLANSSLSSSFLILPHVDSNLLAFNVSARGFGIPPVQATAYAQHGSSASWKLSCQASDVLTSNSGIDDIEMIYWQVFCEIEAGAGGNYSLVATLTFSNVTFYQHGFILDEPSPSIQLQTFDLFCYPTPIIYTGTLRLADGSSSSGDLVISTAAFTVVFEGEFFSPSFPELFSVTYGDPGNVNTIASCELVPDQSSSTQITCSGFSYDSFHSYHFFVQAADLERVVGDDTITSTVSAPVIYSVEGCPKTTTRPAPPTSNANIKEVTVTENCPTEGKLNLTIKGWNFHGEVRVIVGDRECPVLEVMDDRQTIICALPPGTGYRQAVSVTSDGSPGMPLLAVSYAAPQIYNISSNDCVSWSTMELIECFRRPEGISLTLFGSNFGESEGQVKVGGFECQNVTHRTDERFRHRQITCRMPSAKGTNLQIFFSQHYGVSSAISSTTPILSYSPCLAGTRESSDPSNYNCAICEPGTAAPRAGLTECEVCPDNYYPLFNYELYRTNPIEATQRPLQCESYLPGMSYVNHTVVAKPGYYVAVDPHTGLASSTPCEKDFCVECNETDPFNPVKTCCAPGHVQGSPLCALCAEGYSLYGGKCVPCDHVIIYLVCLIIAALLLLVNLVHILTQRSSGSLLKTTSYWVQMSTAFLILIEKSIGFMGFFDFNIFGPGTTTAACIMPLSPTVRYLSGIYIPAFCFVLLIVLAVLSWSVHGTRIKRAFEACFGCLAGGCKKNKKARGWSFKLFTLNSYELWIRKLTSGKVVIYVSSSPHKWHRSPFIRTAVYIFLWSINSFASTVIGFFNCVKVDSLGNEVLYSAHDIVCDSPAYKEIAPVIYAFLGVVCVVPIVLLLVLVWAEYKGYLNHPKNHLRFGVIFSGYRLGYRFWEAVIFIRRVVVIACFAISSSTFKHVSQTYGLTAWLNLMFVGLHYCCWPFQTFTDNVNELLSLLNLTFLTTVLAAFYNDEPLADWEQAVVVILLVLLAIYFVVAIVFQWLFGIKIFWKEPEERVIKRQKELFKKKVLKELEQQFPRYQQQVQQQQPLELLEQLLLLLHEQPQQEEAEQQQPSEQPQQPLSSSPSLLSSSSLPTATSPTSTTPTATNTTTTTEDETKTSETKQQGQPLLPSPSSSSSSRFATETEETKTSETKQQDQPQENKQQHPEHKEHEEKKQPDAKESQQPQPQQQQLNNNEEEEDSLFILVVVLVVASLMFASLFVALSVTE